MKWPGVTPAGLRVSALTSHLDILPTIFDLLALDVPPHVEGRSAAALAQGDRGDEREFVFAERNYTNYYDPARMARSKRYKYVRKGLRTCMLDFVIPEIELCPSGFRRNRRTFEFYSAERTTENLYDLRADPGEMKNVTADPAYREALDEMRAALDAHLEATDDPFRLLRNDLLMPGGVYERVRDQRGR